MNPNVMSLIGAVCLFMTSAVFMLEDNTGKYNYPSVYCYIAAFGIFAHQTTDALDGKLCKRPWVNMYNAAD